MTLANVDTWPPPAPTMHDALMLDFDRRMLGVSFHDAQTGARVDPLSVRWNWMTHTYELEAEWQRICCRTRLRFERAGLFGGCMDRDNALALIGAKANGEAS